MLICLFCDTSYHELCHSTSYKAKKISHAGDWQCRNCRPCHATTKIKRKKERKRRRRRKQALDPEEASV